MKKHLVIGITLLAAATVFSQGKPAKIRPGMVDMSARWAAKQAMMRQASENMTAQSHALPIGPQAPMLKQTSANSSAVTWNAISSSMNVYGTLESSSKPLQYNDELKLVSFIHRKSPTYQPNPYPAPLGAETGAIVGMVNYNWSNTWDSTCIWNDNTNWARYPQGGIYNPPGNTSYTNAYIVATGPLVQASNAWSGNFLASKKLDVFDNVASTVPNAQQFNSSFGPSYGATGKVDFAYHDFTSTDDGLVRSLGTIYNDANATTVSGQGIRGPRILKGTFTSGVFVWTGDSIPINVTTNSGTGDYNWLGGRHNMAWDDAGTIGYVWYYGCRAGATGNSTGYQPVVYKTTNSGLSWVPVPGINFNDVSRFKAKVLDHLLPVSLDTTQTIPFFNYQEGFDGTVDKNGELHIMATVWGTGKAHPDSLAYAYTEFVNWDGETYTYAHGPVAVTPTNSAHMNRPYIYDFYTVAGTPAMWDVAVIDSMATEAPGERSIDGGFTDNPWDGDGSSKAGSDARLQMSRTPGGSKILYTWAESDTGNTNQGRKWNHLPNLHVRMMDINPPYNYGLRQEEFNITSNSLYIKDRAVMHNTSPKCAVTQTAASGYTVALPIKVTNDQNTPMTQLQPNTHWYSAAVLEFSVVVDGVSEFSSTISNIVLFPNPAINMANIEIDLKSNSIVEVLIYTLLGEVVVSEEANCVEGENKIPVKTDQLKSGIYLVNVKTGNSNCTKKLIIE
jgi:hypothetical protein